MKNLFNSHEPKTQEHLENSKQSLFRESKSVPKTLKTVKDGRTGEKGFVRGFLFVLQLSYHQKV